MITRFLSVLVIPPILGSSAAQAAIIFPDGTFSPVTSAAINTTGLDDWGYVSSPGGFFDSNLGGTGASYLNTDFGSIANNSGAILTTVSATPTIGAVTLTEGTAGTNTVDPQANIPTYTFDGNQAHGSYGNFAPSEQDVWQITFNDIGVGLFKITLYLGHSNPNRGFDMDVSGTGLPLFTTSSGGAISGLGSTVPAYGETGLAFTYDILMETTDPSDDLTLTLGGTGGGSGGAIFSGYTVTNIPEPATPALIGLAVLIGFIRRRR